MQPQFNEAKCQGTGEISSLSRFCGVHFTVTLAGPKLKYRSLYRGRRYIEVREIEVLLSNELYVSFSPAKVTVKCVPQNLDITNQFP